MMRVVKWWRRNFMVAEFWSAIAAGIAFAGWGYFLGGFSAIDSVLGRNRAQVYGALATIFGSLLGFVVVAVSVVLTASQAERMKVVRESDQYETLWAVFISTIKALAFATVAALLALVMDRPSNPIRWLEIIGVAATALVAVRLWRSVWILERVIRIITDSSHG